MKSGIECKENINHSVKGIKISKNEKSSNFIKFDSIFGCFV